MIWTGSTFSIGKIESCHFTCFYQTCIAVLTKHGSFDQSVVKAHYSFSSYFLFTPVPASSFSGTFTYQPGVTQADITFSPPALLQRKGIITRYQIQYQRIMTSGFAVTENVLQENMTIGSGASDQDSTVTVTLFSLNASSNYTIKVSACTAVGCDSYENANPRNFTTSIAGKRAVSFVLSCLLHSKVQLLLQSHKNESWSFLFLASEHFVHSRYSKTSVLRKRKIALSWLSSIIFFEGPSFLGLLTVCISPIEQCALVL